MKVETHSGMTITKMKSGAEDNYISVRDAEGDVILEVGWDECTSTATVHLGDYKIDLQESSQITMVREAA